MKPSKELQAWSAPWEDCGQDKDGFCVLRKRVPGGWLVRGFDGRSDVTVSMVFVPQDNPMAGEQDDNIDNTMGAVEEEEQHEA